LDEEFAEWLYTLPSLDREDARSSKAEIRSNVRLGATPGERIKTLAQGKRLAKILTGVSSVICLWGFIYPLPYSLAIWTLTGLPWIALELVRRSRGLLRVDGGRNDAHPTVAFAYLFPGLILLLRAATDFNIIQSPALVWLSLGIGGLLFVATFTIDSSLRGKVSTSLAFGVLCTAYGYGVGIEANTLLDHSPATTYTVTVNNKRISRGKTTTYLVEVGPWGPKSKASELRVGRATYEAIHSGDKVLLDSRRGAFGINWYAMRAWERGDQSGASKSLR
jgi:hypothetical protein